LRGWQNYGNRKFARIMWKHRGQIRIDILVRIVQRGVNRGDELVNDGRVLMYSRIQFDQIGYGQNGVVVFAQTVIVSRGYVQRQVVQLDVLQVGQQMLLPFQVQLAFDQLDCFVAYHKRRVIGRDVVENRAQIEIHQAERSAHFDVRVIFSIK